MKKLIFFSLLLLFAGSLWVGCKKTEELPCSGKGSLSIENKISETELDSISVNIVQIHSTFWVKKDYIRTFSLAGNAPYTLIIDGPGYHVDTTMMVLNCDNKFFVVIK